MLVKEKSATPLPLQPDEGHSRVSNSASEAIPAPGQGLDISGIHTVLKNAVELPRRAKPVPEPPATPALEPVQQISLPRQTTNAGVNQWMWRLLKAALALLLVAIVGWQPLQTLLEPASVEAVVNARLVTLKSPIAGEVVAPNLTVPGNAVGVGDSLLRVVDKRADRVRLDDLRRAIAQLHDERPALVAKLDWARAQRAVLMAQTAAFAAARLRELAARRTELEHELAAATAKSTEAQEALARASLLSIDGATSTAELQRSQRDAVVAEANVSAARSRIASTVIEFDALKAGTFVGDSYNDRPSTAQMADDMAGRISDIEADLNTRDARATSLAAELVDEEKRFASISQFDMQVPVEARIWEVMTAPGEQVAPGQELVKLLDCSGVFVTASVSESVYNHLSVGMPARFRLRDARKEYAGEIVNLTGIAGAPANFAIEPSSLRKEPYRVTVAVPGLSARPGCSIGRTGRVYFNSASDSRFSLKSLLP
jgi:multidrug resistance efflux pump